MVQRKVRSRLWRWVLAGIAVLAVVVAASWSLVERVREAIRIDPVPYPSPIPLESVFPAPVSIPITITADWVKAPVRVTPNTIVSDQRLWRRMHFDDWDTVPPRIREEGLEAMVTAYRHLLRAPREWDRMSATDWDLVPQPIRAAAFMNMMRYWSGYYQVGAQYGLPRGTVTNTLNAILLAESWFEHRAVSVSRSGNRDLGLGQASDYARASMARLFRNGQIDFAPEDDASYFNPWVATRMTAIWFELMVAEQRGDLNAAIRAYHQGSPLVDTPAAEAYLANVVDKRRQFMRERRGTPSWQLLISLADRVDSRS